MKRLWFSKNISCHFSTNHANYANNKSPQERVANLLIQHDFLLRS